MDYSMTSLYDGKKKKRGDIAATLTRNLCRCMSKRTVMRIPHAETTPPSKQHLYYANITLIAND